MTDFDAMSGQELAREAARRMGWPEISADDPFAPHRDRGGVVCEGQAMKFRPIGTIPVDFDPANDLRHAAELGDRFLAAWPEAGIGFSNVQYVGEAVWSVMVAWGNDGDLKRGVSKCEHASEARARTICILKAWAALNG